MAIFNDYTQSNKSRVLDTVARTNSFKEDYSKLSDSKEKIKLRIPYYDSKTKKYYDVVKVMTREEAAFFRKTHEFRKRLRNNESIYDIMPEAYALAREATKRKLGMFHYDVQVEAACGMQDNNIAQMRTGEGKSLVQVLVAYLNVLEATKDEDPSLWKSVHVMTSNEYLAQRDQQDNSSVYSLLGLTSGYVMSQDMVRSNKENLDKKREAYNCDIVYGTTKTIAFDYLEDNHIYKSSDRFMNKALHRAIVDEADDILLDQATRPLILSRGNSNNLEQAEVYKWAIRFINGEKGYRNRGVTCHIFDQYEKSKSEGWTTDAVLYLDKGIIDISDALSKEIYSAHFGNISEEELFLKQKAVTQCLLAREFYKEGKQFQVFIDEEESKKQNCEVMRVVLTDTFTGRSMDKTKYQNGMQEALEACVDYDLLKKYNGSKRLKYSAKNKTVAKCTYPDFFSIYSDGVCGMTGTSDIEEFKDIYAMDTYEVPTRLPNIRVDEEDELYISKLAKYKAILKEVLACQKTGQPILIGTTNVIESDEICRILKNAGVIFQRLDAVNAQNEDAIKQKAGQLGTVTVATNMAGRGIDIKLGKGVMEVGGLYVIGCSKNKNVRIDNQLKGRASRQGNPGKTKYFMSLDDELVRTKYGSFKLEFYKNLHKDSEEKITNSKIISIVNKCQETSESQAKQLRKSSEIKEAKVYTVHKNKIYEQRKKILDASVKDLMQIIGKITKEYVETLFESNPSYDEVKAKLGHLIKVSSCYSENNDVFKKNVLSSLAMRLKHAPNADFNNYIENTRKKMLKVIDDYWMSHIELLNDIWNNALMYGYSSVDPMKVYTEEAYRVLAEMNKYIQNEMITYAANPSIRYGEYEIKQIENNTEEEVLRRC